MSVEPSVCAVIGDVVGSRLHVDRGEMQSGLLAALRDVNELVPSAEPLSLTVGDEFQALFVDVAGALRVTAYLRLCLPADIDVRFGIGWGSRQLLGTSAVGVLQDGPAWWSARDAIVEGRRREASYNKSLRTWCAASDETGWEPGLTNAYLLSRDELIGAMGDRQRRLTWGLCRGLSQTELAAHEGISQSAVSQALRRGGATALRDGFDLAEVSTGASMPHR